MLHCNKRRQQSRKGMVHECCAFCGGRPSGAHLDLMIHARDMLMLRLDQLAALLLLVLLRVAGLRVRIGDSAREQAKRRFGESKLNAKLLAAFALPA